MQNVTLLRSAIASLQHRAGRQAPGRVPRQARHGHREGHRPRTSVPRLWAIASEYLLLLPVGAVVALAWANTLPESYFLSALRMEFLVNDVAMVLFFGLIMKEVSEATARGGVLHTPRRVMLPFVASLGLTLVPAAAFVALTRYLDEPRIVEGWPVLFVSDVAFGYFIARVIFGRHPVLPWFVLIGISANASGVAALALAGRGAPLHLGVLLTLMGAAVGTALVLRRGRVQSFWPYLAVPGALSWCALYFGGFEPALALVPIVPFLPHAPRDPGFFVEARPDARDALSQLELWCRHPAQVALLLFGFVNAGVPVRALDAGTWAIPLTLLVAKPVGLVLGVALAVSVGLRLPNRIGWREVLIVGFISSIGFTAALFFATASVGPGPTQSALKMGALITVCGAPVAVGAAAWLRAGRFARSSAPGR